MTVVAFTSAKGSPGVTTLTCLVGATWPGEPSPLIAECDPAGGDLAARFSLSSRCGWPSFAAALRREGPELLIEPHLQLLPGGLEVLVGSEPPAKPGDVGIVELLASARRIEDRPRVVLFDLGRLPTDDAQIQLVLEESETIVLVSKGDSASLVRLRVRAASLSTRYGQRLGLAVVGRSPHSRAEIEEFTGVEVLGEIRFDPDAAEIACGKAAARRRLGRSSLSASAARLASTLARRTESSDVSAIRDAVGSAAGVESGRR